MPGSRRNLDRVGPLANDVADIQVFRERVDAAQVDAGGERGDAPEDRTVRRGLTRRPSGVACSIVRF